MPCFPADCPKFARCNAAICPLDPAWRSAAHLKGEAMCWYLLGLAKDDAAEHYAGDPVAAAVAEVADEVIAKHSDLARRVARAVGTGRRSRNLGVRPARIPLATTLPPAAA